MEFDKELEILFGEYLNETPNHLSQIVSSKIQIK